MSGVGGGNKTHRRAKDGQRERGIYRRKNRSTVYIATEDSLARVLGWLAREILRGRIFFCSTTNKEGNGNIRCTYVLPKRGTHFLSSFSDLGRRKTI